MLNRPIVEEDPASVRPRVEIPFSDGISSQRTAPQEPSSLELPFMEIAIGFLCS